MSRAATIVAARGRADGADPTDEQYERWSPGKLEPPLLRISEKINRQLKDMNYPVLGQIISEWGPERQNQSDR